MKKLALIFAILILTSCAHQQVEPYVIPQHVKERMANIVSNYTRALNCLKIREDGETSRLGLDPSEKPNAWVNGENEIIITEGLFQFDNDTITFVLAHEVSHIKLKHVQSKQAVSIATTGVFIVLGAFIPGAGLLNYAVNPAVTNNYSKTQEYEADKLASEVLTKCFNIPVDKQIQILQGMRSNTKDGGGFWDQHPSWAERIKNIENNP
jgi:Zn-dependent protease with chaperone function